MTANLTTAREEVEYKSDHILTAKRHDRGRPSLVRPSFPAETRQSASGTLSI